MSLTKKTSNAEHFRDRVAFEPNLTPFVVESAAANNATATGQLRLLPPPAHATDSDDDMTGRACPRLDKTKGSPEKTWYSQLRAILAQTRQPAFLPRQAPYRRSRVQTLDEFIHGDWLLGLDAQARLEMQQAARLA